MTPKTIGPYQILARFGEGGMAQVFKARRDGGPIVCLKRIRPSFCEDPYFVALFLEELDRAEQLHHPNIVEVYDRGEDDGYYLVMELVDGMDLAALLERAGLLDPPLVAYVGCELARALIYIHHSDPATGRPPFVHCDVTPHNVLIGRDGSVKLSDFGIAKALRRTGDETLTRTRGKPSSMSPEQWQGEKIGSRSDLFSLGLVLWRALIGTHPYAEGRPPTEVFEVWLQDRTVANERRRVVEAAPRAPEALQNAIEKLLQLTPERMAAAEELVEALSPLVPPDAAAQLAALVAAGSSR